MELVIIISALLLMLLGLAGSFLPVLPGPLTSWFGLFVLSYSDGIVISSTFLIVTFIIALLIFILDYIIPVVGTKRFGGSKSGMIGTSLGLVVGLLSAIPFGIIIGPFLGAVIGELMHKNNVNRATKAAFGSFIGFITSTFLKFIIAVVYLGLFISKVASHSGSWI
ncbi:hypothetical protein BTO05_10540 [Winogradskyella sp. PC-19]|uniref:DUF456 domain-containing protein n=1 Tax=unclassified Winogradskyella TaxID=2615021 RepID=UPI000B3D01BA|nr:MULTISPECIES: DUF456 domain-containing protein [unclassified Winogradskyella]ARV10051.1 hypothetical protein BTO05_10540 [Winogradskyella sp. PC-19]RZN75709.1 MAG: DUF456 domain-containing protein [Winogradskyella sp.]